MKLRSIPFLILFALGLKVAGQATAEKPPKWIVKTDFLAPFFGNIYAAAQYLPASSISPEVGFGLVGNWTSGYTGLYKNEGMYFRAGVYTGQNLRKLKISNAGKIYFKPELLFYSQDATFRNWSRVYDMPSGTIKDAMVDDKVSVKAIALFINFGKHIDLGKWTLDMSFGYGVKRQEVKHTKTPENVIGLHRNQYIMLHGAIPLLTDEPVELAIQGGCRLGYKLY